MEHRSLVESEEEMSRYLRVVSSPTRKRLDEEAETWEPDAPDAMMVTIESDKGAQVVRDFLLRSFDNVSIWMIYGVPGKPDVDGQPQMRRYVYRCN